MNLFQTILGRTPDETTVSHHLELMRTVPLATICLALAESPEARQRSRLLTPPMPGSVCFFMVSSAISPAVRDILGVLQQSMRPGDEIILMDRSKDESAPLEAAGLTVLRRPGATVFHCRAELCDLGRDQEWIALVEDHNVPVDGWMPALRSAIAAADASVGYISGAVDNRQSREFWSWCSYLITFCNHRPPMQAAARPGIANVLIRRSALPAGPYPVGKFELEILPALASAGVGAPHMVVDHVQPVDLNTALKMHATNARAIGSLARRLVEDPLAHLAAIEHDFVDGRTAGVLQACFGRESPHATADIADGVRLILKTSFLAYSMGLLIGPDGAMYEVD